MAERIAQTSPAELLSAIRKLLREVDALRRQAERTEELADGVRQNLAEVEKLATLLASDPNAAMPQHFASRPSAEAVRLLKRAAQSGVAAFRVEWLQTGEAAVQIDGALAFQLPPALASLLEVLAMDAGRADGILVGWKTTALLAGLMQKKLGRPFQPHTIHTQISRLREALAATGGVNPYLVQTRPGWGARFALRKAPGQTAM